MAAAFLATHGIDLQHEISSAQFPSSSILEEPLPEPYPSPSPSSVIPAPQPIHLITGVRLPHTPPSTLHDIHISTSTGRVTKIAPHTPSRPSTSPRTSNTPSTILPATLSIALPSLSHPHLHIDKAHLLSHPRYSSLQPTTGTFAEAMTLTAQAKARFERQDLLERGNWVVAESVRSGVTCLRAFVEVDVGVALAGVEAGLQLRREWEGRCEVQVCVFAQEGVFTGPGDAGGADGAGDGDDEGKGNRRLMEEAVSMEGVDVVGSTPYVEGDREREEKNVEWVVRLAIRERKHLDLHLDYHLDGAREPLVWYVLEVLRRERWAEKMKGKTVCLGHCTRMTLFGREEWERLKREVEGLPVTFVGLPTSDLFMMGRPDRGEGWRDRGRGTLQVVSMVQELGLDAVLGVNNVGNAFTPQGGADPLQLASLGVGLYQAGTKKDAETLYECVSTRAKAAIGCETSSLELKEGDMADLVLYGLPRENEPKLYRRRRTLQELIYDAGPDRITLKRGHRIVME